MAKEAPVVLEWKFQPVGRETTGTFRLKPPLQDLRTTSARYYVLGTAISVMCAAARVWDTCSKRSKDG
jgi:hypothetical protein